MITCMGLIVGEVTTPNTQDVLNKCAAFCKKYPHLHKEGVSFEVEGMTFATIVDTHIDRGETLILCK